MMSWRSKFLPDRGQKLWPWGNWLLFAPTPILVSGSTFDSVWFQGEEVVTGYPAISTAQGELWPVPSDGVAMLSDRI